MTPEEIAVKLTETEARSKSNTHRLEAVEERQDKLDALTTSMARMDERQGRMDTDVKEIKADVKTRTKFGVCAIAAIMLYTVAAARNSLPVVLGFCL